MGFMNTFDEEKGVPKGGNYGYMDQGAAIKDSLTTIKNAQVSLSIGIIIITLYIIKGNNTLSIIKQ